MLLLLCIHKQCQGHLDCCWAHSNRRIINCKTHLNFRMLNVGNCVTSSPLRRMVQPVHLMVKGLADLGLCPVSHDKLVVTGTKTEYPWSNWSLTLVRWFWGESSVYLFILLYYSNRRLKEGWPVEKTVTLYIEKISKQKTTNLNVVSSWIREGSNILITVHWLTFNWSLPMPTHSLFLPFELLYVKNWLLRWFLCFKHL